MSAQHEANWCLEMLTSQWTYLKIIPSKCRSFYSLLSLLSLAFRYYHLLLCLNNKIQAEELLLVLLRISHPSFY